jgi:hypothetical protein
MLYLTYYIWVTLLVFKVDDEIPASTISHFHLAGVRWENRLLCFVNSGCSVVFGSENCSPQLYCFLLAR